MTAIVMTLKKENPRQNRTAVVQVHSKFLTSGSARSFALTSTFGTFMRPPSPRPSSRSPRLRSPGLVRAWTESDYSRAPRHPRAVAYPLTACESIHKGRGSLSQDRAWDRNPPRRGRRAPARAPTLDWLGDRGARRLGPGRPGVV